MSGELSAQDRAALQAHLERARARDRQAREILAGGGRVPMPAAADLAAALAAPARMPAIRAERPATPHARPAAPEEANPKPPRPAERVLSRDAQRRTRDRVARLVPVTAPANPEPLQADVLAAWPWAVGRIEPHRAAMRAAGAENAFRILAALQACRRVMRPNVPDHATVPIMVPAWALAEAIGCSESYLWALLKDGTPTGEYIRQWVAWRPWYTTWSTSRAVTGEHSTAGGEGERNRQCVKGGMVWVVRGTPAGPNYRPLWHAEDFKAPWRDLEADIQRGLTERHHGRHAQLERGERALHQRTRGLSRRSNYPAEKEVGLLNAVLLSSLTALSTSVGSGVKNDPLVSGPSLFYEVLDALDAAMPTRDAERAAWAAGLGRRLAHLLRDRRSEAFWTRVAWRVIYSEAFGFTATNRMSAGQLVAQALHDVLIGASDNPYVRNRAALVVALMQANGWQAIDDAAAAMIPRRGRA